MSYAGKEMVTGNEEVPVVEKRRKHDPDLEALINPNFSPKIRTVLAHMQMGSLDPEQAHSELMQMMTDPASRDQKTGLLLGDAVTIKLQRLMKYFKTTGRPLAAAYLDVNDFKIINDHPDLGHDIGDIAILIVAEALKETTREEDMQIRLDEEPKEEDVDQEHHHARMGGDEFFVVFPDTTAEQASLALNRFRTRLSELENSKLKKRKEILGSDMTISEGIVQYDPNLDHTPADLIKRAEIAMKQSKAQMKLINNTSKVEGEQLGSQDKKVDLTGLSPEDLCNLLDETVEQTLQQIATLIKGEAQVLQQPITQGGSDEAVPQAIEALVRLSEDNAQMLLGLRKALSHPGEVIIRTDYNYPGQQPGPTDKKYTSDRLQPKDIIDLKEMFHKPKPE